MMKRIISLKRKGATNVKISEEVGISVALISLYLSDELTDCFPDKGLRREAMVMLRAGYPFEVVLKKYQNICGSKITEEGLIKCCELSGVTDKMLEDLKKEGVKMKYRWMMRKKVSTEDLYEIPKAIRPGWIADGNGGWINTGKNYADYLEERNKSKI